MKLDCYNQVKERALSTVWKIQEISVTQILREIIFGHFQIILIIIQTWEYTQCGNFIIFSITQILREINFEDSRSPKSVILTHLKGLNFEIL